MYFIKIIIAGGISAIFAQMFTSLYDLLLSNAILGTHRQALADEISPLLSQLKLDPESSTAEQLLVAVAMVDRLQRGRSQPKSVPEVEELADKIAISLASHPPLFLQSALSLCLADTYKMALPEVLAYYERGHYTIGPDQLPAALALASNCLEKQPQLAAQLLCLASSRGKWLAQQHPEWIKLLPPASWQQAYLAAEKPSQRLALLLRWRSQAPAAALHQLANDWASLSPTQQATILPALSIGLSIADLDFLEAASAPKRQQVRQIASSLLLQLPESACYQKAVAFAAESWQSEAEKPAFALSPIIKSWLESCGYTPKVGEEAATFLALIPPTLWEAATGLTPLSFIRLLGLNRPTYLLGLLKAILSYPSPSWSLAYAKWLVELDQPQENHTQLTEQLYSQLTATDYQQLCSSSNHAPEQAFRKGSVLRRMSIIAPYPWPDTLSKLAVNEFIALTSARARTAYGLFYGTDLLPALPYRIDTALFPWLRQQLHAMTGRSDQYGNQATKLLQIVDFRLRLQEKFSTLSNAKTVSTSSGAADVS